MSNVLFIPVQGVLIIYGYGRGEGAVSGIWRALKFGPLPYTLTFKCYPPDYEKIPNFSKDRGFQNCINSSGATWLHDNSKTNVYFSVIILQ